METWRPRLKLADLERRSQIVRKVRQFFYDRGVLEVDTPSVSKYPPVDLHINTHTVATNQDGSDIRHLISSPEYHMKRLLCAGAPSIFQIGKSFRRDEVGARHNPEFMMLEWYRVGWDHRQLMEEVSELLCHTLGCSEVEKIAYQVLFEKQLQIDVTCLTYPAFKNACERCQLSPPESMAAESFRMDEGLDFLMGLLIEPQLGLYNPVIVHGYPASQASLSRIEPDDSNTSTRFEVFYKGMELGNGFYELSDAVEQFRRFEKENLSRLELGMPSLPIDPRFIEALENGLPDCAGVAVGLDRIIMLALGYEDIRDVITFGWDNA